MTEYSPRQRALAAQKVARRVALNQKLGRDQTGALAAFLQHHGTYMQDQWTWGKPHVMRRVTASLTRRGLIEPYGDGSYRPNASLESEYERTLRNTTEEE